MEIDLWDESRMECLNRMTLWKDLESVATDGVRLTESSSLDNVWKDTFSMVKLPLKYEVRICAQIL